MALARLGIDDLLSLFKTWIDPASPNANVFIASSALRSMRVADVDRDGEISLPGNVKFILRVIAGPERVLRRSRYTVDEYLLFVEIHDSVREETAVVAAVDCGNGVDYTASSLRPRLTSGIGVAPFAKCPEGGSVLVNTYSSSSTSRRFLPSCKVKTKIPGLAGEFSATAGTSYSPV